MADKKRGKLFVISGPSGAGKGTIVNSIMAADAGSTALSISMTTRDPREGEEHGVHYFFATRDEFLEKIDAGGFLEYAEVYGNFYGTPREYVDEKLDAGIDVILEIDIQGALSVNTTLPEAVLIFILPPSMEVLRERLSGRGTETPEQIELRLSKTLGEVAFVTKYDYCVVNDILDVAVDEVLSIMKAEHCRMGADIRSSVKDRFGLDVE